MLFNSSVFVLLVIVTFLIYYHKAFEQHQMLVLIVSSLVFYGYAQPYLLILLSLSASVNAITSYAVYHAEDPKKRKIVAITGVAFNLAVLGFFKYNKLLEGFLSYGPSQADDMWQFIIALPLPIGISFYTFQGISLVMDTYHLTETDRFHVDRRFRSHYTNTFFFITFFPQLVAGPIVKARYFFPQISKKFLSAVDVELVFKSLVTGYFLKSVIADNLKEQTFWIAYPYFEGRSSLTLVTLLFGYSVQIFADFAGYSLIAIGVAAIFGYRLPTNFNFPYISSSIAEFWRRWHISLSSWLREYLYFGLGGNRKGPVRTYVNLIIVMFLGGLWHGTVLRYGVWGLWHGIGLAIERFFVGLRKSPSHTSFALKIFKTIGVFLFVSFGWPFFKLDNFSHAVKYIVAIKENMDLRHNYDIVLNILIYAAPVVLYHGIYVAKVKSVRLSGFILRNDYLLYALMIFLLLVNRGKAGEFIYFQF